MYKGFTLVELMVTMAVAIILMAVGVPLFQQMLANNRVTGQTNSLVTAMTLARTQAVGRGAPVAVCAKASRDPAVLACGAVGDWVNGWLVFLDGAAATPLRVFEPPSGTPALTASAASVRFLADGSLDAGAAQSFRVAQGAEATFDNCMGLSLMGQVHTDRVATGAACP